MLDSKIYHEVAQSSKLTDKVKDHIMSIKVKFYWLKNLC